MLLRRVMEHVKAQNWTAVGLDLVIVVLGVFIGIQVANWNDARAVQKRIDEQLASFKGELIQRQPVIATQKAYLEDRISSTNALRAALIDQNSNPSDEEIYSLSMSALRANGLDVAFHGFEELSTTGALSNIESDKLLKALYGWDAALSDLRSTEEDVLTLRNQISMPPIIGALSFGNMARTDPRFESLTANTRFTIDLEALRQNRDFDNALVGRAILEDQNLRALIRFEDATTVLIDAIGDRE